jgi:hypothetical protein
MIGAFIFFDGCGKKPPDKMVTPAMALQKQASDIEKVYTAEIIRLSQENDSLKSEIAVRKQMLLIARSQVSATKNEVVRLIVKEKTVRDTVLKVVYCDSLQRQVDSLLTREATQDSLCERQIVCYAREVQSRDSALAVCQKSFSDLKSVVGNSFEQEKELTDQLNEANGKLRRRTVEGRLLSAVMLIISGIAASTFIIHR